MTGFLIGFVVTFTVITVVLYSKDIWGWVSGMWRKRDE